MKTSIVINPEIMKCAVCGRTYNLQWHHIIHGTANRVISDRYGLTCWLCMSCHEQLHCSRLIYWREVDEQLKASAQRQFENRHSHEEWMELFKKNYIDN